MAELPVRSGWDWTSPQITTLPNCFPCPFLLFLLPSPEILSSINTTQKSFGQTLLLAKVAPDSCHEVVSSFDLGLQLSWTAPSVHEYRATLWKPACTLSWEAGSTEPGGAFGIAYYIMLLWWSSLGFLGRSHALSLPPDMSELSTPQASTVPILMGTRDRAEKDHKQGKNQAQLSISRLIVLGLGM